MRAAPAAVLRLSTRVSPGDANHSFNGIFFDIEAVGLDDVLVHGIGVGGDLGPWSVYWKDSSWRTGFERMDQGWRLVGMGHADPSWNEPRDLMFNRPVLLRAGVVGAVFVHSATQHDRGIAYQTYPQLGCVVVRNADLAVYCGRARIGHTPFVEADQEGARWGWYRDPRGLAGCMLYEPVCKVWSPTDHASFPKEFRDVIVTLLLCWNRDDSPLAALPLEGLYAVFERLQWRDFVAPHIVVEAAPVVGRHHLEDGWF